MLIRYFTIIILSILLHIPLKNVAQNNQYHIKTIVIDPGHGGKDSGTAHFNAKEKEIVLEVALLTGDYIKRLHPDVKIVFTRKTDVFVELDERAKIANKNSADLFISIHANACDNPFISGAETFVLGLHRSQENLDVAKKENSVILLEDNYEERYEGFDPNSEESLIMFEIVQDEYIGRSISFASKIQTNLIKFASLFNREVKQAGFLVLRKTAMPSVLIELGFVSNAKECEFLMSKSGHEKLAESIATAFSAYKNEIERNSNNQTEQIIAKIENETKKIEPIISEAESKNCEPQRNAEIIDIRTSKGVLFCVQIATSDKLLHINAKSLKSQANIYYTIEKGVYKYFAAVSTSLKEVKKEFPILSKKFNGAFIVAFSDGIKTDIKKIKEL